MNEARRDFQPTFEKVAKTVGTLMEAAYNGMDILERHIFDALDKQVVNRLLCQYDKLAKAGFSHQEALDAVTSLIKRRLETAVQERSQNDN